ncbi:hypothetical protein FACS1894214_2650 [Planctomycetales bacterium]|nr:hypothetical protein FACS1894214_2650 [Planctomycetales bacterium]
MKKSVSAYVFFFSLLFSTTIIAQEQANQPATENATPAALAKDEPVNLAKSDKAKLPLGERLATEKTDLETPANKDIKIEKIGKRLPNGYRNIVSTEQRDEIYKIQLEYGEVIERLQKRLELLELERDLKIDLLLSDEQIKKLKDAKGTPVFERRVKEKEPKKAPAKKAVKKDNENI